MPLDERSIAQNLTVMFLLLPAMLGAFWGFIRLMNRSTGVKLKAVMEMIYSDPLSSAIYRGSVVFSVAYLVKAGFDRWV